MDGALFTLLCRKGILTNWFTYYMLIENRFASFKERGGMNPLHFAAKIGNLALLAVFLAACPSSVEDVTAKSETVFHIAVRRGS